MKLTSFVPFIFSTTYCDAPAEEQKVEETPEASEEAAEKAETAEVEEEPEPEDVGTPRYFLMSCTHRHEPSSYSLRFEKNVKIVLNALRFLSIIYIARRRSTAARASRERIVLKNCKPLPYIKFGPVADVLNL